MTLAEALSRSIGFDNEPGIYMEIEDINYDAELVYAYNPESGDEWVFEFEEFDLDETVFYTLQPFKLIPDDEEDAGEDAADDTAEFSGIESGDTMH